MKKILFLFSILMFALESHAAAGEEGTTDDSGTTITRKVFTSESGAPYLIKKDIDISTDVSLGNSYGFIPVGEEGEVIFGEIEAPKNPAVYINAKSLSINFIDEYTGSRYTLGKDTELTYHSILKNAFDGEVEPTTNKAIFFKLFASKLAEETTTMYVDGSSSTDTTDPETTYKILFFIPSTSQSEAEFAAQFRFKTES